MARAVSLLLFLSVTAAWLALLPRLKVTTAITHFMPEGADKRAARLAKEIAEGEIAGTLVLDVSGDEADRLAETALALVAAIRALPETSATRSGVDEAAGARLFELLGERSPTALVPASELDDARLTARIDELKARLGSPMGPFVRDLARRDPLGGALGMLEEVQSLDGDTLTSKGGVLFTRDEKHAFVFAVSKTGAFDAPAQRRWLEAIDAAFVRVRSTPSQRMESSGVARMSVAAEAQIRGDIERIGGISTLGIILLFALLFRSPRMLGLGLVPLWFGSALAIVATQLVFGEIHGLTLAFGTSLLGVGIDYAEHFFSHFALEPEKGAERVMRSIWPGLWMGALTTILGFSGLGLTGFPGVRQIAFFSAVSIVGALFGTRFLLPAWMPRTYRSPAVLARLAAIGARAIEAAGRRRWLVAVPALLGLAFVPGLARTKFVDDISVLVAFDPALLAEDVRVRERVSPVDPGRFAVVVDPNEDVAIIALARTTQALEAARRDGILAGYLPLGSIVRPSSEQRASFARAKADRERIATVMREQGFVPEAFGPFFDALDRDEPALLTLADLRTSPIGPLIGPLCPRLGEGQAFILPLRGVKDLRALRARLPDAAIIDQGAILEETYRDVRKSTVVMLAVGLALIVLVLVLRYRAPRIAVAAFLPGVLGAGGAISWAGLAGTPLNVLHLISVLLVLSMGIDFGIFVVEGRASPEEAARSLVSIATATTTTLLSFGLLALSPSPALRTLGVTITLGLLLGAALCPLSLVLLGRKERA